MSNEVSRWPALIGRLGRRATAWCDTRRTHVRLARARASHRQVMHMLHVGKTGGTAIKSALRPHVDAGVYTLALHAHAFRLADVPEREACFLCLRDPITRFQSAFSSRLRRGGPAHFYPWSREESQAFRRFATAVDLAEALSSPYAGERAAAERAMRSIQHVRDSYEALFGALEALRRRADGIRWIGFQESLDYDFAGLLDILGLPPTSLPSRADWAHRGEVADRRPLSDLARTNLRSWYATDYMIYEWARERWKR